MSRQLTLSLDSSRIVRDAKTARRRVGVETATSFVTLFGRVLHDLGARSSAWNHLGREPIAVPAPVTIAVRFHPAVAFRPQIYQLSAPGRQLSADSRQPTALR